MSALGGTIIGGKEFAAASPPASRDPARRIVLHADDLGMNEAVDEGIFQGFEQGVLTSSSLLSNAPHAAEALDRWRELESRRAEGRMASAARRQRLGDPSQPFDLGVHLNLTQGRPLIGAAYPAELLDANGCFPGIFSLFRRLRRSRPAVIEAIDAELSCQTQFLLDRGHRPTHLNGHQYIEMLPAVTGIVESLVERFRIPVVRVAWEPAWGSSFLWPGNSTSQWLMGGVKRLFAGRFRRRMLARKVVFADAFFGTMTAGTTSLETVRAYLAAAGSFPLAEVGLHPAAALKAPRETTVPWHDPLADLRPHELKMLLSTELYELLAASDCQLGRLDPGETA